jgi:hypothetical protein
MKYKRTSHTNFPIPLGTPTNESAVTPTLLNIITTTHKSAYFHAEGPISHLDLNTNVLFNEKLNTELIILAANPLIQITPVIVTCNLSSNTANPHAKP